jgi:DNA primase
VELALPMLTAERSLRLAALPAGEDPDTLVRRGAGAFQPVLDAARPLSEALFDLVRETTGEATPEQRAALRGRLEEAAGRIRDKPLAGEYRRALLDRFFQRRPAGGRRGGAPTARPVQRPVPAAAAAEAERGRTLLAILLRHPGLLHDIEEALGAIDLPPPFARLRAAILHWAAISPALDSNALVTHLTSAGLAAEAAQALSAVPYPLPGCARADAQPAEAEAGWWHIFGLMHRGRLEEEVAAASRAFASRPDEAAQRRLIALCTARDALRRGEQGQDADL